MAPETAVQAPESAPKTASRWEDFIDVFISPAELFRRRANDSWWVPLLVMAVIAVALFFAFWPIQRVMQETRMLNNPDVNLTPDQINTALSVSLVIGAIVTPVMTGIIYFLIGLFAWIGGKITSIDLPFKRALTITVFVGFIGLIQQILGGILATLKLRSGGELDLVKDYSFGVLRFMQTAEISPGMIALLSRIDIFALWAFALYVIAFMTAAKAPRGMALLAACIPWLVSALPFLMLAFSR